MPIQALTDRIGELRCAAVGPTGRIHTRIGQALDLITPVFEQADFTGAVTLTDYSGVMNPV